MTPGLLLTDLHRARDFLRAGVIRSSGGRSAMLKLPRAGDQVYLYIFREHSQSEASIDLIAYRGTFTDQSVSLMGLGGAAPLALRSVDFDPTFRPLFAASEALSIASGPKWRMVRMRGMASLPAQDANYIDSFSKTEKGYSCDLQTHDLCLL